jgi:hypothetical protein
MSNVINLLHLDFNSIEPTGVLYTATNTFPGIPPFIEKARFASLASAVIDDPGTIF